MFLYPSLRRFFRAGDIDGFLALALENFIDVLLIISLCKAFLGFSNALIYGRVLPGVALSLCLGNCFYAWMAVQEGKRQGRNDMTALPFGINIVSLLVHIFLIMLPVRTLAISTGASVEQAAELAWQAGVVACFTSGILKLIGLWSLNFLQRSIPLAAHLSSLGGIALTFIAMGFFLQTFANPIVGLVPLGVVLLTYFGQVKFVIPGGLLTILLGTALAWGSGFRHWDTDQFVQALQPLGFYVPRIWLEPLWQSQGVLLEYLSVLLPLGMFEFLSGLQCIESAAAAGDSYSRTLALTGQGVFTLVGSLFGACFPLVVFIGHPAWKAAGARSSYSVLTGILIATLALTGTASLLAYFIPIESGIAIFIAISLCIVSQSFTAVPSRHIPAVVIGMLPAIAAWGAFVAKSGLQAAGLGTVVKPMTDTLIASFQQNNLFIHGALALEQGYLLTAIMLSSMTVHIIEKQFRKAALWALIAAIFSWFGLMHSYRWTVSGTIGNLSWGAGSTWAIGYGLLAILLLYAHWQEKLFNKFRE